MSGYLASLLVQCSWSYTGGQGLGFVTTALALAIDSETRARVWPKYRALFNTNPYMAGALAGITVHYERQASSDIDRLFGALQSGFGSTGDNFFWRLLRPALSVLAVALAVLWPILGPLVFLVPYVLVTQTVRISGLARGLATGKQAALELSGRLTSYAARLDVLAAFLCGLLAVRAAASGPVWLVVPVGIVSWSLLRSQRFASYLLLVGLLLLLLVKLVA